MAWLDFYLSLSLSLPLFYLSLSSLLSLSLSLANGYMHTQLVEVNKENYSFSKYEKFLWY